MALSITDLKKGAIFEYENVPYRVVEYAQKVMGRGGSIVNVKIKSLIDGKVLEKTFKGSEQLNSADVSLQNVSYLYSDDKFYYFMNDETFEQFEVDSELVAENKGYLKEGDKLTIQLFDGRPINLVMPKNVNLEITYTEDVVRGDTTSALTKDATTETGLVIKVPSFIKTGDIVSVDTSNGNYRERVRD